MQCPEGGKIKTWTLKTREEQAQKKTRKIHAHTKTNLTAKHFTNASPKQTNISPKLRSVKGREAGGGECGGPGGREADSEAETLSTGTPETAAMTWQMSDSETVGVAVSMAASSWGGRGGEPWRQHLRGTNMLNKK